MQKLPKRISEDIDLISEEGNALFDQEKYDEAINKWKKALNLLPPPINQWEAAMWLNASIGDAYYQMKAYDKAREAFLDALNFPGEINPFIYYRLGQIEYKKNNIDESLDYLTRAYMLDGEDIFKLDDREGGDYSDILKRHGVIN